MAKVTDTYTSSSGVIVVLCDCTPPRSGDPAALDRVGVVNADFICVAYNPGKLARADSVAAAYTIKERTGKDVVFNMATRDMNKIAVQSRLLGAQMMGLENVVVLQGDGFTETEAELVKTVGDFTPTGLVGAISVMNEGLDYRGSKLRGATDFCIGATLDLERDLRGEVRLTQRKVAAGAHYFIAQPIYDLGLRQRFLEAYEEQVGGPLTTPVFWGLQVLDVDGIVLGNVPPGMRQELDGGRAGSDIAGELLQQYVEAGIRGVYLVPPILRGGARDYEAAQQVLESIET
ncbi:MAG: methylenetetrahydrofolate reductase [Candidatus Marinimicrobia bacterium]|nr:methylenetetrahydrofolate reductase [Candidatus Neomarinimicrobiota bacterium]